MKTPRTAYKLDINNPGSDLAGETAASLAFKPYESSYSNLLLVHGRCQKPIFLANYSHLLINLGNCLPTPFRIPRSSMHHRFMRLVNIIYVRNDSVCEKKYNQISNIHNDYSYWKNKDITLCSIYKSFNFIKDIKRR